MQDAVWTSGNGLRLADCVPAQSRAAWIAQGHCPGRDLYSLFRGRVAAHPERIAVISDGTLLDYADLDTAALFLAARLQRSGFGERDVIALNLPNGWRAVAAELAVAALGAVALTYPVGTGRADSAALIRTSRAATVLTEGVLRELLPDPHPEPARGFSHRPIDSTAPARILTSSGSESEPKLVAYAHDAMAGGRGNYVAALFGIEPAPRILLPVQLASSYGSLGVVALLRCGATLILPAGRFDAAAAVDAMSGFEPSHVCAVPTMLGRMARVPGLSGPTPGLRTLISSGAPLPGEVLTATLERFGVPVVNVYGSSDGVNCRARWATPGAAAECVGRPDPAVVDLVVADERDRPLPTGAPGQILARGPMSPLCYVGRPDLDARHRTADGWVRSGDLGVLRPDGTLAVLDRIKRVIKRGGYSVSPAQVEAQAVAHPCVADAACVPLPDPDLGQRLCLCVVPRRSAGAAPTLPELRAFLEAERGLARRALPDALAVLPALPLGPTGKVCLKTLTERAAAAVGAPPPRVSVVERDQRRA